MSNAFMLAYPWDLLDEGSDGALDRLQGETGATGVAIWAVVPPMLELRVRPVEPRIVRTQGGSCFAPVDEHYRATRCKPLVADALGGSDALEGISQRCRDRGLSLRLVVTCTHAPRMAQRSPDCAARNMYGDRSQRNLCPINKDVEKYVSALVADVGSRFAPDAIVLTDWRSVWGEAFQRGDDALGDLSEASRSLLSICFCESCLLAANEAGIDAERMAHVAKTALGEWLTSGRGFGGVADDTPVDSSSAPSSAGASNAAVFKPIVPWLRWRDARIAEFVSHVKQACDCDLWLDDGDRHVSGESIALTPPTVREGVCDGVITPMGHALPKARDTGIRCGLRISVSMASGPDPGQLVASVARATEAGFDDFTFDHYGAASDDALSRVRQAIRFARRGAVPAE